MFTSNFKSNRRTKNIAMKRQAIKLARHLKSMWMYREGITIKECRRVSENIWYSIPIYYNYDECKELFVCYGTKNH